LPTRIVVDAMFAGAAVRWDSISPGTFTYSAFIAYGRIIL
jgi:hypothetical protein